MQQLLGLRFLIENIQEEVKKTESGLIIPITVTKPKKGKVFRVGIQVQDEIKKQGGTAISEGVTVLYEPNEYPQVEINGKSYDMVYLENVYGEI